MNSTNNLKSIFCANEAGPSFGSGDIDITNKSNTNNIYESFSDLGDVCYTLYKYVLGHKQEVFSYCEILIFQVIA